MIWSEGVSLGPRTGGKLGLLCFHIAGQTIFESEGTVSEKELLHV